MRSGDGRIVVTGSVAFDYLMTFPGQVRRAPDPGPACRACRSRSSWTRCGACRAAAPPTSPTAWRCSASGRLLLATAGARRRRVPRPARRARGSTCRACGSHDDVFTASFFVSTDQDQNQIASFYTGAMARARDLSLDTLDPDSIALRRHLAQRPAGHGALRRRVPGARNPVPLRPEPAGRAALRRGAAQGLQGAAILIVNDYEFGILTHKTGLSREEIEAAGSRPDRDARAGRLDHPRSVRAGGADRAPRPGGEGRERRPSIRREWATPTAPGLLRGLRIGAPWAVAGRIGSVAAVFGLEAQGPQPPRYTPGEFRARYVRNFGEDARAGAAFRLGRRGPGYNSLSSKEGRSLSMRVSRRAAASFSPRQYEGSLDAAGLRFGVVCARWNPTVTDAMLAAALDALRRRGAKAADVAVVRVPGAFELAAGAKALADSGRYRRARRSGGDRAGRDDATTRCSGTRSPRPSPP